MNGNGILSADWNGLLSYRRSEVEVPLQKVLLLILACVKTFRKAVLQ